MSNSYYTAEMQQLIDDANASRLKELIGVAKADDWYIDAIRGTSDLGGKA